MKNSDIDDLVFSKICEGISKAKAILTSLPASAGANHRTVDNSLRRLKSKGRIEFIRGSWWSHSKEPSRAQWSKERETLEKLKAKVPPTSGFGDDHHAGIDAQINVIDGEMTEDQIYGEYGDNDHPDGSNEKPRSVLDAALDCRRWMDGEGGAPSDSWKEITR